MGYKPMKCKICGKEVNRTSANQKFCIDCSKLNDKNFKNKYNKSYYQTHREEHDATSKQWALEHPDYQKEYYAGHREQKKKSILIYQKNNPEAVQETHRKWHHERRMKAFKLLGGKCANPFNLPHLDWCNSWECLQIDHIYGGGSKHHKARNTIGIISDVLKDPNPKSKYQLLCANCNWIKRFKNHE